MADILDMKDFREKKAEFVWECSCGSQLFYLHVDGTIECRSCKLIRETIEWMYRKGLEPK
jgi:hypothetical protein